MRRKGAEALELAEDMITSASAVSSATAGIDYLFHVAGGSQHAAAEDTADEVDRDMFELNVLSAIGLTKAILRRCSLAARHRRRRRVHGR